MTKNEMIIKFNEVIGLCNRILLQSKVIADECPEYERMMDKLIDIVSNLVGDVWAHCLYDQPVVFMSVDEKMPSLKVNTEEVVARHGIAKTAAFFKELLLVTDADERLAIVRKIQS